mmetsp:Transcript_31329/g.61864  ORF Transcript_31329/g.61864 Transcript_31329/m.61864 type:complete len:200 (+) Transcript_31329:776-1375(+)
MEESTLEGEIGEVKFPPCSQILQAQLLNVKVEKLLGLQNVVFLLLLIIHLHSEGDDHVHLFLTGAVWLTERAEVNLVEDIHSAVFESLGDRSSAVDTAVVAAVLNCEIRLSISIHINLCPRLRNHFAVQHQKIRSREFEIYPVEVITFVVDSNRRRSSYLWGCRAFDQRALHVFEAGHALLEHSFFVHQNHQPIPLKLG